FLQDRDLRKTIYEAHATRASDQGPHAGKWDNTPVMDEILKVRHEIAQLVGFSNFADYSLATKMAKSPDDVLTFLNDLATRSRPLAALEYEEVTKLAKQRDGITDFSAWDFAYYSQLLQEQCFNFSDEDFRPYFPIQKVLNGMFTLIHQLYGITITEESTVD